MFPPGAYQDSAALGLEKTFKRGKAIWTGVLTNRLSMAPTPKSWRETSRVKRDRSRLAGFCLEDSRPHALKLATYEVSGGAIQKEDSGVPWILKNIKRSIAAHRIRLKQSTECSF